MHEQIKNTIEQKLQNVKALPTLPDVAQKVMQMVNDPNVDPKVVAEEISKDQAMTANILKLSNSAFFNKGKEITSVDRAIVTLGIKEVKDIIMVVAAKPILDKAIMGYDLAKGALWEQGLLVATLAKKIALLKKRKDIADVVFTGGIIHNIGKIVLALFVQSTHKDILQTVIENSVTFNQAEKDVMGYSHVEVGEKVVENWNFPTVLKSIVRYYQEPESAPEEHAFEVATVHVANMLSIMAGVGVGVDGLHYEISEAAVKTLGLNNNALEAIFEKIPEIMKLYRDLK